MKTHITWHWLTFPQHWCRQHCKARNIVTNCKVQQRRNCSRIVGSYQENAKDCLLYQYISSYFQEGRDSLSYAYIVDTDSQCCHIVITVANNAPVIIKHCFESEKIHNRSPTRDEIAFFIYSTISIMSQKPLVRHSCLMGTLPDTDQGSLPSLLGLSLGTQ